MNSTVPPIDHFVLPLAVDAGDPGPKTITVWVRESDEQAPVEAPQQEEDATQTETVQN